MDFDSDNLSVMINSSCHITFDDLSELSSCESPLAMSDSDSDEENRMDVSETQKSIREVVSCLYHLPSADVLYKLSSVVSHKVGNLPCPSWIASSNSSFNNSKLSDHSSDSSMQQITVVC